jgi:hypothetical protein
MDIYSTYYMLSALVEMPPEHTFFKNRYFPTNQNMDIFGTAKVIADYKSGDQKMAPFVVPRIGPVPVGRSGYSTYELNPANISVSRTLTLDDLKNRGFGESLMSDKTPEDRSKAMLLEDLHELSARISRTEEYMACKTMLDNGITLEHRTDKEGVSEVVEAHFYDGADNPAQYTHAGAWTHSTDAGVGSFYEDIRAMAKMLTKRGLPATDLIVAQDVGDFLLSDSWILRMLDNRRADLGNIAPTELTPYVTNLGAFVFGGRKLNILISDGQYESEDGASSDYIPSGSAIVTAPGAGRGLYGAVSQVEPDREYHTYASTRVPKYIVDEKHDTKQVSVTCRPLMVPNNASPWSVLKNALG